MILVSIYKIIVYSQSKHQYVSQTNQSQSCVFVFCMCLFIWLEFFFNIKIRLGIHYLRVQWNTTYLMKQMHHHSTFITISNKIKIPSPVNIQWKFVEGMSNKAFILTGRFPQIRIEIKIGVAKLLLNTPFQVWIVNLWDNFIFRAFHTASCLHCLIALFIKDGPSKRNLEESRSPHRVGTWNM